MLTLFTFGHISIYLFGVTIAVGILAGMALALRESKKRGLSDDAVFDVVLWSLVGGMIGARIIYVLVYDPSYYLAHPLELFQINEGGLSIHGGILGGVFAGVWRTNKLKMSVWEVADILAPALILAQAIGRIGCDVFGLPMTKPYFWGVEFNGVWLHPAQVYELTMDYILFAWLWIRKNQTTYHGEVFVNYLIGFSLIRGIVELFRSNPELFNLWSVSHFLNLAGIVVGLCLHVYLKKRYPRKQEQSEKSITMTMMITLLLIIISVSIYYFIRG